MRNAILVENGSPRGAIHLDAAADGFHRFVAAEIQRYLELLTGGLLPIVTEPGAAPAGGVIMVGGPQANDTVGGLAERGALDLGGLTADGAYLLKSIDLDGRGCVVAAGRDDAGTMYAAYELLERLGVVFQLTGDIVPERKPDLELPELDVAAAPARKFRGVHVWHAYTWNMGMEDYRRLIDQIAKMKMNVLEFYWGMGAPWVEVFHDGVRGELTTTPESGYLAVGRDSRSWGRSVHTTTGTRSEVRVGRECFPHERLCAEEFREVGSEDEAFAVAVPFLREIIRYAHRRCVQVWLVFGELPFVSPNLAPQSAKVDHGVAPSESHSYQRYCGVAVPTGDPAALDIWEAALCAVIETYPEADSYGVWAPEHSPDFDDDEAPERCGSGHGDPGAHAVARGDPRGRQLHPQYRQGPGVRRPADAPGRRADRPGETAPPRRAAGRVAAVPRLPDARARPAAAQGRVDRQHGELRQRRPADGLLPRHRRPRPDRHPAHRRRRLRAAHADERHHVRPGRDRHRGRSGRRGGHHRPARQGARRRVQHPLPGRRLLGRRGRRAVVLHRLPAAALRNGRGAARGRCVPSPGGAERDLVWWGRSEIFISYHDFSPCKLRTGVELRDGRPDIDRAELERAIEASWDDSDFWFWRRPAVGDQHEHDRPLRPDALWRRRAGQYRAVATCSGRRGRPAGSCAGWTT